MRLPRFSLRTLFIAVTLLSLPIGWVAYQLDWKQQRYNFLLKHRAGALNMFTTSKPPWSLRLFGVGAADYVVNVPEEYVEEARRLFPEARKINPQQSDFPKSTSIGGVPVPASSTSP
jgi:hypothetical protein